LPLKRSVHKEFKLHPITKLENPSSLKSLTVRNHSNEPVNI